MSTENIEKAEALDSEHVRFVHCPVCVHEYQLELKPGTGDIAPCDVCGTIIEHFRFADRSGMMARIVF